MKKLIYLVILVVLSSCTTLQHQKGYENYSKNTDWKVRKL